MKPLSKKATAIAPSSTLAINALANQLIKEGKNILKFGTGEPDFNPTDAVKEAAIKAVKENNSRYTEASGLSELKQAFSDKLKEENNLDYSTKQIIVSNGAKHSLMNVMQALLNEDDEVIVPRPAWVTFKEQVQLVGGVVKWVDTDENFKLHADEVEKAVSEKTKAIIINSPCNPTGAVFEENEIKKIIDLAVENDFYIVSDECYEHFVYNGKFKSIAAFSKEAYERTLTVNAASKTYAITGWRIGFTAGPENIIKTMANIQSHITSNPCNIAQMAVVEALRGNQDSVKKMVKEFNERREYTIKHLNEIKGFDCPTPEGAFYAFPRVNELYKGDIKNSADLCSFLLKEAEVALVPGDGFEADDCIRFSYASSMDDIKEGIERIKTAVEKI